MNGRLSTWLLLGVLVVWPLAVYGQRSKPPIEQRTILNLIPGEDLSSRETSRGIGSSVSVRELSIPERAKKWLKKGVDRLAKNDSAGSLVYFQRAASEFPDFYEAYYAMGLVHFSLGHQEEAGQAFEQSITASGGRYSPPHFGLATLLCSQQKFSEAEPIIRKALELSPSFGAGYYTLAWALFGLNHLDEAGKNAREALVRDPTISEAHLLLAKIYASQSNLSAVLVELDAYLRLTPDGEESDQIRRVVESLRRKLDLIDTSIQTRNLG
jgi:tetratricopeptide (TPR) repeat protein